MKTITEFTGLELKQAFQIRDLLINTNKKKTPAPKPAPAAPAEVQETAPSAPDETQATAAEHVEPPLTETPTETIAVEATPVVVAPADAGKKEIVVKSPEELLAQRQEERRLEWEAKINEIKPDFAGQVKEKFKWSDERIEHVFHAMDAVFQKKMADLRFVRVMKIEKEGEEKNKNGHKVGDSLYVAEYYAAPEQERRPEQDKNRKRRGKGGPRDGKDKRNFQGGDRSGPGGPGSGGQRPGGPRKPFNNNRPKPGAPAVGGNTPKK